MSREVGIGGLSRKVMKKSFFELLKHVDVIEMQGADVMVSRVEYDSRKVTAGAVFCALSGLHTDGEKYIASAIKNGAVAVVYERDAGGEFAGGVCYAKVKNARLAMSHIAAALYDYPSTQLGVIGVTGTEGKSSTVSFIWQLLNALDFKTGYFSTVSYSYGGASEEKKNPEHQTTPESTTVQERLFEMKKCGCLYAVVESSSHGLSPLTARLADVAFDVGVFMNVTEEHLEFHKTFECYRNDKANLFRKLDENSHEKNGSLFPSFGVVNMDDPSAEYFCDATKQSSFGFSTDADIVTKPISKKCPYFLLAADIVESGASIRCGVTVFGHEGGKVRETDKFALTIPLAGIFNVKNILASMITVSQLTGTPLKKIADTLAKIKPITGRMFNVDEGQNFTVLIDYAHTPSSFETIMPSIAESTHRAGKKLIALFGSGGERDTAKRPEQGRIASQYCDVVILADEDPRGEDSLQLLEMIARGVQGKTRGENLFIIPDRKAAIRKAFSLCNAGDAVLLLGKGHENSIIFSDRVMPYDEETEARAALRETLKAASINK